MRAETQLAEFVTRVRAEDIPQQARKLAVDAMTDCVACAIAGASQPLAAAVLRTIYTAPECPAVLIGTKGRAPAPDAALYNGAVSHALDYDDIGLAAGHVSTAIIPAALAVAEREHASGRAFLAAVTIGYEAAFRIGEAVNPSHYYFFHPTGTVATFGAAAAAASLMRLNGAQMLDALGSAGTQAAALWEFNADGAMSKHLHPGKAAMNGIIAADLARAGFTGATRILEGERGFFRAMSKSFDESRITDGLGVRWKIGENGFKLYSCCGHTHTAVDCALEIRARRRWSKEDVLREVSGIAIETYGPGYEIVKEMNPRTPYQAKFSLAYCAAAALLEGALGLEQFDDSRFGPDGVRDRSIAELLRRVRVSVADDLTAKYPASWPVRLSVETSGGAERASSEFPKGHPEHPVSTAELEQKFTALVGARFGRPAAASMLAVLHAIEQSPDMADAFAPALVS